MSKKVLISGGAGFIGSNLALKLLGKSYDVTILDNLSQQIHGNEPEKTSPLYNSIKNKVIFIKGNIKNKLDWKKSLKDQDIIIHLAAETGTGQSMYQIEKYVNTNIKGTAILLDILANEDHNIQKVILASSRAIYGEGKYKCSEHGIVYPNSRLEQDMANGDFECKCPVCAKDISLLPTDEKSEAKPISIYGITKLNQEQMLLTVSKALNIPSVALRFQNVYGPGQSLINSYTGILSIFSTQIRNKKDLNIFEDGMESRDFVYIEDVIDSILLCIESDKANYEIINVGSDEPINIITVAKTLKDKFNSSIKINISGDFRTGDIRHNYADLKKIKSKLGYLQKFNFETGISKFVSWVIKQEDIDNKYDTSILEMKKLGLLK